MGYKIAIVKFSMASVFGAVKMTFPKYIFFENQKGKRVSYE